MQKLLISSIALAFTLAMPLSALADSYDDFMRKGSAEFENPNNGKCKEKNINGGTEGGYKISYQLCIYKNQPVFLRTVAGGEATGISTFKGGKLVELSGGGGTGGVGFRNGQPVVEWNSGATGERRVNWKLTAEEKSGYLEVAAKEKRILRKFGY
jgi:hypothetical protein